MRLFFYMFFSIPFFIYSDINDDLKDHCMEKWCKANLFVLNLEEDPQLNVHITEAQYNYFLGYWKGSRNAYQEIINKYNLDD